MHTCIMYAYIYIYIHKYKYIYLECIKIAGAGRQLNECFPGQALHPASPPPGDRSSLRRRRPERGAMERATLVSPAEGMAIGMETKGGWF